MVCFLVEYLSYFFNSTVKWNNYLKMLKKFFWSKVVVWYKYKTEFRKLYFQLDGAPHHRKKRHNYGLKRSLGTTSLTILSGRQDPGTEPLRFFFMEKNKGEILWSETDQFRRAQRKHQARNWEVQKRGFKKAYFE